MKRTGNIILFGLLILLTVVGDPLAERKARLDEEPDRGGGRGSIEEVLLTIGGWTAAILVSAGLAAFAAAKLGLLK